MKNTNDKAEMLNSAGKAEVQGAGAGIAPKLGSVKAEAIKQWPGETALHYAKRVHAATASHDAPLETSEDEARPYVAPEPGIRIFRNDGSQREDTAHLDCPACGGSGHIDDYKAGIQASEQGVPDGWKLVPVQPTARMHAQGGCAALQTGGTWGWVAEAAYAAMLDAAPTPPVAQAGDARDAARYRYLRMKVCGTGSKGFDFVNLPPMPANWARGSIAQHFDEALDAAISAAKKGGAQ